MSTCVNKNSWASVIARCLKVHVGGNYYNHNFLTFLIFCRFSTCWPAFQKDTNGILIVYNPDQANHDKELETWYEKTVYFSFQQYSGTSIKGTPSEPGEVSLY